MSFANHSAKISLRSRVKRMDFRTSYTDDASMLRTTRSASRFLPPYGRQMSEVHLVIGNFFKIISIVAATAWRILTQ